MGPGCNPTVTQLSALIWRPNYPPPHLTTTSISPLVLARGRRPRYTRVYVTQMSHSCPFSELGVSVNDHQMKAYFLKISWGEDPQTSLLLVVYFSTKPHCLTKANGGPLTLIKISTPKHTVNPVYGILWTILVRVRRFNPGSELNTCLTRVKHVLGQTSLTQFNTC